MKKMSVGRSLTLTRLRAKDNKISGNGGAMTAFYFEFLHEIRAHNRTEIEKSYQSFALIWSFIQLNNTYDYDGDLSTYRQSRMYTDSLISVFLCLFAFLFPFKCVRFVK